jgi:hypothetical protein
MNSSKHPTPLTVLVIALVTMLLVATLLPASPVNASDAPARAAVKTPTIIYGDRLATGWQDWSWNASINLSNTRPLQSGTRSIKATITQAYGALYLHNAGVSTSGYTHLSFYVHGGPIGGQRIQISANGNTSQTYKMTATAKVWTRVTVPLSSLGSPATLVDLYWQDAAGKAQPVFYVDNIRLIDKSGTTSPTQTATKAVTRTPTRTPTGAQTQSPTKTPTKVPTKSPTPVKTSTPSGTGFFDTLPPGSRLPSDAECAAAVKARPENKRSNATYNATRGNQGVGSNFLAGDPRVNTEIAVRIDGNFTGTTDEILQWVACKWGINEDIVRAQAAVESWWRQSAKGDWTTDASRCAPGHGIGVDGTAGQCPESFGILQNRYPYEQSAWPGIDKSTAFNADAAYGIWRACYEGYETWLMDVEHGSTYVAGDAWGCVGRWFAGRWHTSAAETYITRVKDYKSQRIWETAGFQEP